MLPALPAPAAGRRSCRRGDQPGSLTASVRKQPDHFEGASQVATQVATSKTPPCNRMQLPTMSTFWPQHHGLLTRKGVPVAITPSAAPRQVSISVLWASRTGTPAGSPGCRAAGRRAATRAVRAAGRDSTARAPTPTPWRPPPPRDARDPYPARQQPRDPRDPYPPRQQPPRQQMTTRDRQGDGGQQRFGASAEAAMPRLPSPRWSGQGRILGRPDIKVPTVSSDGVTPRAPACGPALC